MPKIIEHKFPESTKSKILFLQHALPKWRKNDSMPMKPGEMNGLNLFQRTFSLTMLFVNTDL